MVTVQIVLYDGFDLLDAIAPYEVFCAAAEEEVKSVASGINGLKIETSGRLNPELAGIIVVPGASGDVEGDGPDSVPVILTRAANTVLTDLIERALKRRDVTVATVCGGSLVLAMGGLLEGRPSVTNRLGMEVLGAAGAVPVPARVVDDGNLVTGGGVTSGLDVALHLVEREIGPRIAHAVERLFEYERRGTVWRAAGMVPGSRNSKSAAEEEDLATDKMAKQDSAAKVFAADSISSGDYSAGVSAAFRMAVFAGDWDTTIATPVGKLQVKLSISIRDGVIQGSAAQNGETAELIDPFFQNGKLVWSLRVAKPMRLNMKFEVSVDGDVMYGVAKAGILPTSKLTGRRSSVPASLQQSGERHS